MVRGRVAWLGDCDPGPARPDPTHLAPRVHRPPAGVPVRRPRRVGRGMGPAHPASPGVCADRRSAPRVRSLCGDRRDAGICPPRRLAATQRRPRGDRRPAVGDRSHATPRRRSVADGSTQCRSRDDGRTGMPRDGIASARRPHPAPIATRAGRLSRRYRYHHDRRPAGQGPWCRRGLLRRRHGDRAARAGGGRREHDRRGDRTRRDRPHPRPPCGRTPPAGLPHRRRRGDPRHLRPAARHYGRGGCRRVIAVALGSRRRGWARPACSPVSSRGSP